MTGQAARNDARRLGLSRVVYDLRCDVFGVEDPDDSSAGKSRVAIEGVGFVGVLVN
jgi:hypothetical protein